MLLLSPRAFALLYPSIDGDTAARYRNDNKKNHDIFDRPRTCPLQNMPAKKYGKDSFDRKAEEPACSYYAEKFFSGILHSRCAGNNRGERERWWHQRSDRQCPGGVLLYTACNVLQPFPGQQPLEN